MLQWCELLVVAVGAVRWEMWVVRSAVGLAVKWSWVQKCGLQCGRSVGCEVVKEVRCCDAEVGDAV